MLSRSTVIPLIRSNVDRAEGDDALPRVPARGAPPPSDEAGLVRRLGAGESAALTEIAEWLWESLAAYAYRIIEDRDIATDIAQEALVRLWDGRGHKLPKSLRPYLFRIARNLALDHRKTRRTRSRLLRSQEWGGASRPAEPDEVLERERVSERVECAIQGLPERRREVFTLAYLRGLSYAEVGEVMGISPKTVQHQMSAALAQLRAALQPLMEERRVPRRGREGRGNDAR